MSALKTALSTLTGRLLVGDMAVDLAQKQAHQRHSKSTALPSASAAAAAAGAGTGAGDAAGLAEDPSLASLLAGGEASAHNVKRMRQLMEVLAQANDEALKQVEGAEKRVKEMEDQVLSWKKAKGVLTGLSGVGVYHFG